MRPGLRARPHVIAAALFALWVTESRAASPELLEACGACEAAVESEDLEGALVHAKHAVELAELEYGERHEKTATLLLNLGAVFDRLERFDEELRVLSRAVRIREHDEGPPSAGFIEAWRYRPLIKNGKPTVHTGVQTRFVVVEQKSTTPRTGSHIPGRD